MKQRLDAFLTSAHKAPTRSQAGSMIRLGEVKVNGTVVTKAGHFVSDKDKIVTSTSERYVGRAGLKLSSVADRLDLQFEGKIVLDVGSSTGGFTDYALQNGARKVFAVDVGTDQLHPSLRNDERIELYEKTDIRDFIPSIQPDIIVMDVSFISVREILPHIASISGVDTQIIAMVKPQFEAGKNQVNKGVIKNDSVRRDILKNFEIWSKAHFVILDKADSDVAGARGNRERFYLITIISSR